MNVLTNTHPSSEARKITILIVDDNPASLGLIASCLEAAGYKTPIASNGELALKRAKHICPDLILLDIMPGLDGFETCRRLKADNATKDIPVIFMTGMEQARDKVRGFEAGGADYVTKPFYQEEVLARIEAHLRIRKLTRQLQRSNADKDKLFLIITHDLRNQFNTLIVMTELLSIVDDTTPLNEIRRNAGNAYRSARNLHSMLENLLEWARLQQGRIEYQPARLDLRQIVAENVDLMAVTAMRKNVHLVNQGDEKLFVWADENMLSTVIRNLLSNALKFAPAGGEVTIKTRRAEGRSSGILPSFGEISIAGTGVGICEKDLDKLFKIEAHHSTFGTEKEKGIGLGLILCKEMVEKNKGQILIESTVGKGTVVRFSVPLKEDGRCMEAG